MERNYQKVLVAKSRAIPAVQRLKKYTAKGEILRGPIFRNDTFVNNKDLTPPLLPQSSLVNLLGEIKRKKYVYWHDGNM